MNAADLRDAPNVAEGKRRAAESWANLTDEQRVEAERITATAGARLARMVFVGEPNAKGRSAWKLLPE